MSQLGLLVIYFIWATLVGWFLYLDCHRNNNTPFGKAEWAGFVFISLLFAIFPLMVTFLILGVFLE